MTTPRSRSTTRAAGVCAAAALLALAPGPARAGDAPAHTSATVIAARIVADLPEFANGVGAPQFVIPTGNLIELACPYDYLALIPLVSTSGACEVSDPNGVAINAPDVWNCLDPAQPPSISALNSSVSLGETALAQVLGSLGFPAATVCNWNHFVTNPKLGTTYSAASTADLVAQWADQIPAAIASGAGPWSCTVNDWNTYYARVVNGLHYRQDAQTEHHAIGNETCGPSDVVPTQAFNRIFTFDTGRACQTFLSDTTKQAANGTIPCDWAVIDPTGTIDLSPTTAEPAKAMCDLGVALGCMGLERLFRHHCNVPDQPAKSITCKGPPSDHLLSTNTKQYCEGEIYDTGGGQDFLGAAVAASLPPLIAAAHRWASVCPQPGDGIPDPPSTVGVSMGDPHLCSFDGVRYDFQTHGECTLVEDADDGFEIQTRMQPYNNSPVVAVNVGLAAQLGTDVVALYVGGRVTVNHADVTLASGKNALAGGGMVWRAGDFYTLVWPDNTQLRVGIGGSYLSPHIFLSDPRRGRVTGPLGNADGVTAGELVTRDGMALGSGPIPFETFHGVYIESWRVGATSLFDYPANENTENFTDRSFPRQLASTSALSAADAQLGASTCASLQVAPAWTDSCVMDVGFTGDRTFAGDLAQAPPVVASIDVAPPASPADGGTLPPDAGTATSGTTVAIPGLFPTGVDDGGAGLPSGANDPHYQILSPAQAAVVINPGNGSWLANTTGYRWIWQTSSGSPINVTRTFRTTFSLDGLSPSTASLAGMWATDNYGTGIALNGQALGIVNNNGFASFTGFTIPPGSPFVAGINTLDFTVQDTGTVAGFVVGSLSGTAAAPCGTNADCPTGVCNNGTCTYGASCLAILEAGGSVGDGPYWVTTQGTSFQVYCDMTTDGGGWTRVAGINATDHNHVTSAAVNPAGMTTATALGKFADVVINGLKSGSEPGLRLTCQNSATPVTGYFSTSCPFSASPTPGASGTCTAASYVYQLPESYGGQFTQSCVVGLADGTHGTAERLIYGANASSCNNGTTGCDTQFAHWGGNGSLWVR